MDDLFRDKKGSLTVEAAIVLPIFICVIMTFALFMKVAYVHSIIQHAITEAAHEMATNSYIYHVSGLSDIQKSIDKGLYHHAEEGKQQIKEITNSFNTVLDTIFTSQYITNNHMDRLSEEMKNLKIVEAINIINSFNEEMEDMIISIPEELNNLLKNLEAVLEEPQGIAAVGGELFFQQVKTTIGNYVIKGIMKKHLTGGREVTVEERLNQLQIQDIDFSKSRYYFYDVENDVDDVIDVVVTYKLNIPLPIRIINQFNILQRTTVKAWMGGKNPPSMLLEGQDDVRPYEIVTTNKDIWGIDNNLVRGREINSLIGDTAFNDVKLIDKVEKDTFISIRSYHLGKKTYLREDNYFLNNMKKDVNDLVSFQNYNKISDIPREPQKMIQIVIPYRKLTEGQEKAIEAARAYAKEMGIGFKVIIIRDKSSNS